MRDRTAISGNCTIQLSNGSFCDKPGMDGIQFPICTDHAIKIHVAMYEITGEMIKPSLALQEEILTNRQAFDARRKEAGKAQSVVYYLRIGDRVKIGFTTNMKSRLVSLRVPVENVLATEPGGRELESQRHKQFAAGRHGRTEEFNPSRALLEHIETVRMEHGEPRITSYPKVA